MWAHHHCFGSRHLQSVVVVIVVVDDDVRFRSRWGLGGKGEKIGFGDVEKMMLNLVPWKSSLV